MRSSQQRVGIGLLDERTAEVVRLLLAYCCPVSGSTAQRAWLCGELAERRRVGVARYRVALQAGNGRDAEADLRQELEDACAYSWQAAIELMDGVDPSPRPGAAPPPDGRPVGGTSEPCIELTAAPREASSPTPPPRYGRAATPAISEWNAEPTEPGWYWRTYNGPVPHWAESPYTMEWVGRDGRSGRLNYRFGFLWHGPLQPPALPGGEP